MQLTVFLPSAQALTFEDANILVDDVNLLIFTYVSKGNKQTKQAKFYTKNIVGHAQTPLPTLENQFSTIKGKLSTTQSAGRERTDMHTTV